MIVPSKFSVDVAISAYGKPYQTAVTLFSLLKHSGQWIDKIYFVEERKQPEPVDFQFIYDHIGSQLIHYKPFFWFWYNKVHSSFQKFRPYRQSIRYQYGWEKTDKDYLLLLHNDVYFTGDLVGEYLRNIGEHTGIGKIGQCWNCPAFSANMCDGKNYTTYRPDYQEIMNLSNQFPGPRSHKYADVMKADKIWPLPECRLNEYVAMVNMKYARPATVPFGKATPIGVHNRIDTGVEWFYMLNNAGHTFTHFDYEPYAIHSWVSLKNAGHEALFNKELYQYEESVALQCLKDEFGYQV
ncbi:MAG: hypothetical protein ABIN80_07275 [Dyadobacter sp.]|uniref:hypothetical protein n=1 Tax=Dyadobacter sp. TaxID=1914288 RepID=UPI003267915E